MAINPNCVPKMRVEKGNPNHDDLRVLLFGAVICVIFIVFPVYVVQTLWDHDAPKETTVKED